MADRGDNRHLRDLKRQDRTDGENKPIAAGLGSEGLNERDPVGPTAAAQEPPFNQQSPGHIIIFNNEKSCEEDVKNILNQFIKFGYDCNELKCSSHQELVDKLQHLKSKITGPITVFFFGYGFKDRLFLGETGDECLSFKDFCLEINKIRSQELPTLVFTNTLKKKKTVHTTIISTELEPDQNTFHIRVRVNGDNDNGSLLIKAILQEIQRDENLLISEFTENLKSKLNEMEKDESDEYEFDTPNITGSSIIFPQHLSQQASTSNAQVHGMSMMQDPQRTTVESPSREAHPVDTSVGSTDLFYKVRPECPGIAVIIAMENFQNKKFKKREGARTDAKKCKMTFESLNYSVWDIKYDPTQEKYIKFLEKVQEDANRNNYDSLVIVFMSHGSINDKEQEFLQLKDSEVRTNTLWEKLTADKCPGLKGKPKMIFIQACRGILKDEGVPVPDSVDSNKGEIRKIPSQADLLIMWASYPGYVAFRSPSSDPNCPSVFLSNLTKVLKEDHKKDDLSTMLLRVTREVAVKFISCNHDIPELHKTKQIPYTVSTLMRKVQFF